jgi:hypothetical protein
MAVVADESLFGASHLGLAEMLCDFVSHAILLVTPPIRNALGVVALAGVLFLGGGYLLLWTILES